LGRCVVIGVEVFFIAHLNRNDFLSFLRPCSQIVKEKASSTGAFKYLKRED
jgi:hypothetical protein